MCRRTNGKRQTTEHRHATVESHHLHRDLSLVVVHRQHRVETFLHCAQEYGVSRKRAFDVQSLFAGALNRGFDDLDLFHAETAAVAGMRIETCDGNPRILVTGLFQAAMGQRQLVENQFGHERRCDVLQGNVRGDPSVPDRFQNVELARLALESNGLGDEANLVVIARIGVAHGLLLRDMIIEGELKPGERIYEGPLCQRLGVSRTPLREALRYLASEGLVDLTPQRGASVRQFSAKDIEDMLILIRSLEELAGQLACKKASDEEVSSVRQLHDDMLDQYRAGNRLDYYKTNQRIHSAIVALSHNEPLIQVHASLQSKLKRVRFIGHEGQAKWAAAVAEHESMIEALERRDSAALVEALGKHLEHAWERVRDIV